MESVPTDCSTFLGLCAVTGLTLSILHIARDHILLYQKSSLLSAVVAPNYSDAWWLGNLNHLWFLWHLILIIALFSFLWPMISKIFGLTRVRRAVALSLEHPLGLLGVWGSTAFFSGLRTVGIRFQLTPTGCRSTTSYFLFWVLPDWLNRVSIED